MSLTEAAAYALTAVALIHGLLTLWAVCRWRPSVESPVEQPPVTILKPLCGAEVELEAALRSFCEQDYPAYQIVCGVRHAHDPAVAVVQRLQAVYPHCELQLVIDSHLHGSNYKISNLLNLSAVARHDWWVLADSDMHVPPQYLSTLMADLQKPGTGIVTCAYRGRPQPNLASRLGAMYIADWFLSSVLLAQFLWREEFAFGATIALHRDTLRRMGGFEALTHELADDYLMSHRTRKLGLKTRLSPLILETTVDEKSLKNLFQHELRWMRTNRLLQPLGYAFIFLTFTLPLALLGIALAPQNPAVLVLGAGAILTRFVLHFVQRRRAEKPLLSELGLLPLRDVLTPLMWVAGFMGRQVQWGGHRFDVQHDGTISEDPSKRS